MSKKESLNYKSFNLPKLMAVDSTQKSYAEKIRMDGINILNSLKNDLKRELDNEKNEKKIIKLELKKAIVEDELNFFVTEKNATKIIELFKRREIFKYEI